MTRGARGARASRPYNRGMARAGSPLQQVGRWIVASAAFALVVLFANYVTMPDVRPLATRNPETTAFMELRASAARARGQAPKRVQYWVGYPRISPHLFAPFPVVGDAVGLYYRNAAGLCLAVQPEQNSDR